MIQAAMLWDTEGVYLSQILCNFLTLGTCMQLEASDTLLHTIQYRTDQLRQSLKMLCKFYIPGVHKFDNFCEFLLSWTTSVYCGHVYQYNVCQSPMSGQCPTQLFLGDINHSTGVMLGTSVSRFLPQWRESGLHCSVLYQLGYRTTLYIVFFNWAGREPKSLLPFPLIQILLFYLHLTEDRYVKVQVTYSTGESYLSPIKTHFWLQLRLPITPAKHTTNT